ncbi:hypothetical protein BUALT_Bualt09G0128100 [Buddleja alternifolia]|uniref:Leucine-rich repeat-containing N-terminal plant-type domain-containing protein n=1 Tax=Buddleja alternifolia TaxID=168488 RepID=A0AAV6X268_9LAMI|nr:hypothetical protein BUALT_Bualt09G0128100 [Buddleja alternifolia]
MHVLLYKHIQSTHAIYPTYCSSKDTIGTDISAAAFFLFISAKVSHLFFFFISCTKSSTTGACLQPSPPTSGDVSLNKNGKTGVIGPNGSPVVAGFGPVRHGFYATQLYAIFGPPISPVGGLTGRIGRHGVFSFLFLLLFLNSIFSVNFTLFVSAQCLHDQKELLIELRNSLTYDSSLSTKLVHWNESTDCCQWLGVKCDSKSRVSTLDLSSESISGGINDTLFRLVSLRSLNLAENSFDSVQLPSGFGKLTNLSYLNLSNSDFSGMIPFELSNLTRLTVLDLSSSYSSLSIENSDIGRLIHSFTRLRELYLDGVNISAEGYDWCNAISSSLPNLQVLSLSGCQLTGPLDSSLLKLQSLSIIRLDSNTFSSPFPEFFADFRNLRVLSMSSSGIFGVTAGKLFQSLSLQTIDLSNNRELEGSFLEFPLNGSLQYIMLAYTLFSGNVPESIGNLRMLSEIYLNSCNFSGPIPRSIKNLTRLTSLGLSINHFNGSVPSFALLKNLNGISLRGNDLTGQITDSLWEGLDSLDNLDLSDNSIEGEIPTSLFVLPSLRELYLYNNSFHGSIRVSATSSLSPLEELKLGVNHLEGPIPRFLFELQNLSTLSLASNKFNGSVGLNDFQKLTSLASLDLSYNDLSVHVSENVSISSLFPRLGTLMLASCKIRKIPLLKNQSSLMMLDLSGNLLDGEIPNWMWEVGNGYLRFLNLSNNQFTRLQEPYHWRGVDLLGVLDLHNNMLSGQIPVPPPSAFVVDFSNNKFSSSLPPEIGNFLKLAFFFSVANNKVVGTIPLSLCNASHFQVLDLSNNSLHGAIPSCLLQTSLRVLNLRRNNLNGHIPSTFPIGCGLETLDLSWNVVQGGVPESLTRCTELEVLNLGNNELGDDFPCWLKNLTKLHVIVLRKNKFHGNISCLGDGYDSPSLQIIDLSSNNFNGVLPANLFQNLMGMVVDDNDQLDHLHFDFNRVYYQDSVTVTLKGQDVELAKILTIFTSLDFSNNHFQGAIPETIGEVKSLYVLNFSHNALSGSIPASLGNLQSLESLDLSFNNLVTEIPEQLASLTFLSFLNLSRNKLVGSIPSGNQMQTFSASSFLGNEGLCGFPLNKSCSDVNTAASPQHKSEEHEKSQDAEIFVSVALGFVVVHFTLVSAQCLHDQKELLIELRNSLTYDSSLSTKLVHWNESTDCCQWLGVKCDSKSRVSTLDLSSESITGGINDTLFRLVSLRSLNLAENSFDSVQLPSGFGKLTNLSYLNLSNSDFSGMIPFELSNLTRLTVLDLSSSYSSLSIENSDIGRLIHSFTRLRELYLDGVNISAKGYDWCNAISSSLPNLRVLSLSKSYLRGPLDSSLLKLQSLSIIRLDSNTFSSPFPAFFADFHNLRVLSMSGCDMFGVTPGKLFQIPSLQTIDLSNNRDLKGSFLEFPLNGSLENILLSYTQFSGNVPESIGNLKMLSKFDLRACNFSGPIPRSVKNLTQLTFLDLSINQFNGHVPSFALLKNLTVINLRLSGLTGQISDSLWEGLESLEFLDLSENSIEGEIPTSLFVLPSLTVLHLSNNSFHGSIRELKTSFSSHLEVLELGINNLEGPIPRFLFELHNLSSLSLASNKFNGSVGLNDFRKLTSLVNLDLSYNDLFVHVSENVSISSLFPRLGTLMLASCKIRKIPLLKNQSSLMMLDLSGNQLDGEIPNWIWEVAFLRFLNLSNNQFARLQEPYHLRGLDFLDLHNNMLSGRIPVPPPSAAVVDFSNNKFSSSLPPEIGNFLRRAFFFSVANNKVIGTIPLSLCNASHFQVLDLSNNNLQGAIPSCLLQTSLRVLNLRRNNLNGHIPSTFPIGCGLETLDLSWNVLRGGVPESLTRCTELEVLNLGNNELSGDFPCWLKNLTKLQVIVLRNNKFHGNISCLGDSYNSPSLQIIDLSSNNFNGVLPANLFRNLMGMVVDDNDQLDHLHFDFNHMYYQDSVTVTLKGQDVELGKILTIFTSLDFSNNHFQGIIPETIGDLKSLYVLNFSHNAVSGRIPASLGNLKSLESLDLSFNNLGSGIPEQLASLTFLSFLNLSHNKLDGRIPSGNQMQTFPSSSFLGNEELCGFPLTNSCSDVNTAASAQQKSEEHDKSSDAEIFVSVALGYVVGIGFIFGPLLFSEKWRRWYNKNLNKFVSLVLHQQGHKLENEDW